MMMVSEFDNPTLKFSVQGFDFTPKLTLVSLTMETEMVVEIHGVSRPVNRLSDEFAAVRLHFTWFGVKKTLNDKERSAAAGVFDADSNFLSAGKKLINTRHESFKKLTGIKTEARQYWINHSLPYPESGVRLIRLDSVQEFDARMESIQAEMRAAIEELNGRLGELIEQAREKLGELFNVADYPSSFTNCFSMEWDYPNMRPPEYLRMINPEVYEQEVQRIQNRFREAASMAETAFMNEFSEMVEWLKDRMQPDENGNRKKFKANSLDNIRDFFERFSTLNIGCREDLERLISQARSAMDGVSAEDVRDSSELRERIRDAFSDISQKMSGMIETAPRRSFG